jgi:hypothetical protein
MLAVPLWVVLVCGGCGGRFEGNARSVPQWAGRAACPACWGRVNDLRAQLDLPRWDTPADAYPTTRPEG